MPFSYLNLRDNEALGFRLDGGLWWSKPVKAFITIRCTLFRLKRFRYWNLYSNVFSGSSSRFSWALRCANRFWLYIIHRNTWKWKSQVMRFPSLCENIRFINSNIQSVRACLSKTFVWYSISDRAKGFIVSITESTG